MPIPILPPAPSRTDPANFAVLGDAWVAALPAWTDAANALEQSLQLTATTGTSTTSLTIGTGSKTLNTQTGKVWSVGSYLYVVSSVSVSNLMIGQVTAYNSGTGSLTVNVTSTSGSGTISNWILGLSAPLGSSASFSGTISASVFQLDSTSSLYLSSGNPVLQFDTDDYLSYDRTSNTLKVRIATVEKFTVDGTDGPQRPNDATTANGLVRKSQLPVDATTSVAGLIKKSTNTITQTGTATDCAVMPADLAASMLGGVGQTYQDVTASRALGVTYTNSTGRMIEVSVWIGGGGASGVYSSVTGTVDGINMYFATNSDQNGGAYNNPPMGITMRVKAGSTYKASAALTGGQSLDKWVELR